MKLTALNAVVKKAGGKMVPFAGWEMPVRFSGDILEHQAVRTRAGLFDVSHMGEFFLSGKDALKNVENWICNTVKTKPDGGIVYSPILKDDGTCVDDLLVYRVHANHFVLVVNAGNIDKDFAWLKAHLEGDATFENRSDRISQLAIQGPLAEKILEKVLHLPLGGIKYYNFVKIIRDEKEWIVSRTGYTGEDGFEVYLPNYQAPALYEEILETGRPEGLIPIGLGARDTLRVEASMPLYGHEIDEAHNPIQANMKWTVKLDKERFIGKEALKNFKIGPETPMLVGLALADKGHIARQGYPIVEKGAAIGVVTSGIPSPTLGKNIANAFVPSRLAAVGTNVLVSIRGKECPATVIPTPYYKRKK